MIELKKCLGGSVVPAPAYVEKGHSGRSFVRSYLMASASNLKFRSEPECWAPPPSPWPVQLSVLCELEVSVLDMRANLDTAGATVTGGRDCKRRGSGRGFAGPHLEAIISAFGKWEKTTGDCA